MQTLAQTDRFVAWHDDEVIEEVARCLNAFTSSMVELAQVVGACYRRGIQDRLEKFGLPELVIDTLRKIESGQIDLTLAEKFMHTRAFNYVKSLPLDDQKVIAKSGKIDIVVQADDGNTKYDFRKVPVEALTRNQLKQVFDRGRIRSRVEQQQILEDQTVETEDEFPEPTICVKITAEIDLTKAQRKELNDLKEKAGSMSALVKQAILRLL